MAGKHSQKKNTASSPKREQTRSSRYGGQVYVDPRQERAVRSNGASGERKPSRAEYEARYNDRYNDRGGRGGKGSGRIWLWAIPLITLLLAVVVVLGVYMSQAKKIARLDTIYPNISVNGIEVGGLTVEEAAAKLETGGADAYKDAAATVLLPMDTTLTVTAEELGIGGDTTVPALAAYNYGRDGSLMENMKTYRACQKTPLNMNWDVEAQLDEALLLEKVKPVVDEVNTKLLETEAVIDEEARTITIVKGVGAAAVDIQGVCGLITQSFAEQKYDPVEYELAQVDPESGEQVLKAIYDSIFAEPVNAVYDEETGGATESQQGKSFDMEAALELWEKAETGEEIVIELIITEPEIDSKTLSEKLFADCLAEKSTSLSGSSSNRINNVTLAAQALNNTVINPGKTFDYNSVVGERTTSKGYKEAGAYANGKHVTNVGGGICQNSSTLYYCALYANLDITVRDCHYFTVDYLPRGLDATVSWGGPDFRFINDRDYPIKIKAWVDDGYLTVQLWGTDEDGSYVKIESDTWEDDDYYYAQTYRAVYDKDGNRISYVKEAYSRYHKHEANTPTPKPTETAAPSASPDVTATPTPTAPPPAMTNTPAPTNEPTPVPTNEPTPVPPTPTEAPPTPTEAPPTPTEAPPEPTQAPPEPTAVPPAPATDPPAGGDGGDSGDGGEAAAETGTEE